MVRHISCLAIFLAIGLTSKAGADESARALVEKAVQAIGGLKVLDQDMAARRTVEGEFPKDNFKFVGEIYGQSDPRALKIIQNGVSVGDRTTRIMAVKKDSGWISVDGVVRVLDKEFMEKLDRARHADKVAGLVALLTEKGFTLTKTGADKVNDKAVWKVKVHYDGQPDMTLYFDQKSGFLVKTWQQFFDPDSNRQTVHELFFKNYQSFDFLAMDRKKLAKSKLDVPATELLQWLEQRTPNKKAAFEMEMLFQKQGSNSYRVRTKASSDLKKIGPEVVPLLERLLKEPGLDPEIIRRSEQCLEYYAQDDTTTFLLPAVIRVLGWEKPRGVEMALLNYLKWAPSKAIREEVKAALFHVVQIREEQDSALVAIAKDKKDPRREMVADLLQIDRSKYYQQPGRRLYLQGIVIPTRSELHRDGGLQMQLQTFNVEYFNRFEDSVFAQPD